MSATSRLKLNEQSIYAQQCYDATWTLARALNNTLNGEIITVELSII